MLIHIFPDPPFDSSPPAAPQMPRLSNMAAPSTTDLVAWATYMTQVARQCVPGADPSTQGNAHFTLGMLMTLTDKMQLWLADRLADEERNLLLMDRLRHEERQEAAHVELMATDDDYASEWDGGDDE